MRSILILAALAGVCVAVFTSLKGPAQRSLGPAVLVAISGLTGRAFAPLWSRSSWPGRSSRAALSSTRWPRACSARRSWAPSR